MENFINKLFSASIVKNKGIVRRNKRLVHRNMTHNDLVNEVKKRGFHLIETGDQYIIICNNGALQIHC